MSTSKKTEAANRHHGGPGSSHQRSDLPDPTEGRGPAPGQPTNGRDSDVSGGGGVRDSHHTHDPKTKGGN
ncbi:hypothetical protein [Paracoccus benzoatiresistens]|uniref:Uncharacterized protein n=1 Tax=Paracoccus benzoatiresistens TaxID=2997341 RepID=A0ABT4J9B4_9RHOB|nr:hypothetical protein [Paracoccus sp. EF6]MCZ0963723.1 hypothetical protein [Paracoccus sp. EF6]